MATWVQPYRIIIQFLIGQSLDVMSWLFTATYTGSMVGTLICGPVCDRVGPQLVLFVSTFMASCLTGVFIYSPNFTVMLIVRVFTGIFIGGVDIGNNFLFLVTDCQMFNLRRRILNQCLVQRGFRGLA